MAKWAGYFGVSTSGYYAWRNRKEEAEDKKKTRCEEIKRIFEESGGTCGPERIAGVLRRNGEKASRPTVERYMAEMGLSSIHNRHRTRSLVSDSAVIPGNVYEPGTATRTWHLSGGNPTGQFANGLTGSFGTGVAKGNTNGNLQPYITCYMWKRTA